LEYLLHEMIRRSTELQPEKEALVFKNERLTYSDVYSRVMSFGHALQQAGLQRGERVGIYLEPSVEQALSIFGTNAGDGVFVPMNHQIFPEQVLHIMKDCEMTGLVTTENRWQALLEQMDGPAPLKFVLTEAASAPADGSAAKINLQDAFHSSLQPQNRCIEKDLAAILYTSGSTGKPKGVMLTHAQIMAGSTIVSDYLGITEKERILAVLPFNFDAGLNQIMTAFQQCASLIMINFVFAREIVKMLEKESITGLAGVPTLWSLLSQPQSTLAKTPLPALRYITNTGGAMPQPVLAKLREYLPQTQIFLMYGLTEAFRSTYLPPDQVDSRPTSIGKAIPDTEILVINEQGNPCKPGEIGELVHRGPTVSLGYWGYPDLTDQVLRPYPFAAPQLRDWEKVCYSGDLVKLDEEGYIYFVGRRDTMIKSSGFRISPTEVEEVIFRCGQVVGAAVIGIPDEVLGQHIKAFVVRKSDSDISPEAILTFCAEHLPRYMVPQELDLLNELPKTPSGKVDYPALRRREGL
jgi:acyl-CoA ligase (AMP-forming) (exosortase A-associated)